MPFRSERQRRFMFSQHPDIARRWVAEGKGYIKEKGGKMITSTPIDGKKMKKMFKTKKKWPPKKPMNDNDADDMKKKSKKKKKNWIAGAIKHPGALHRALGVKQGTKIPAGRVAAAANRGGKVGREARLAETLRGMHHKNSKTKK